MAKFGIIICIRTGESTELCTYSKMNIGMENKMEINNITIVGMGALGILYGDFFTKKLGKEHVNFVADDDRINRYKKDIITCNGKPCDFTFVNAKEKMKPADLVIFAVKATALGTAIKTARNKIGENTIILSVLNGISSEEIIGKQFGMKKIIYCVAQGMDAVKIGNEFTFEHIGQLCIGIKEEETDKREKLNAVANLLEKTAMPYTVEADIIHRLWSKFMLNVGVNQTIMIYEGTYRTVQQQGEARELMKAAMKEVIMLARYENINIGEAELDNYVSLVDTLNPMGMPSMRQDGLEGRKSEVEFFAGTVLELAKKHGINTPVNQRMYHSIIEMEKR